MKFKIRKGFTIVEVLVATFLLSIVIALPLADVFIRTNFRIRRMQQALSLERDLIERIKAVPYNSAYIADDGDNASSNNIKIYDDSDLIFTIKQDGEVMQLRYNGNEWRLR